MTRPGYTEITWIPPGHGQSLVELPPAAIAYIRELEGLVIHWRAKWETQNRLRVEAEARAGRLAREARR
jgi:hypothetical protein